jgi:hypothetical protein
MATDVEKIEDYEKKPESGFNLCCPGSAMARIGTVF